ncbi:hypothetical protein Hanom_Chr11g01004631 [Helianthus anomalus]
MGVDESVNPFHDDFYKKAIYHRTNEQPPQINRSQISEGSSKERKQALAVTQEDEGFNWNKYIPKEKHALDVEVKPDQVRVKTDRERQITRSRFDDMSVAFEESVL